jgi:hypothetical protein
MVMSHRGDHLYHPENTLPAFQAAIDAGADFFEGDIRRYPDCRLAGSRVSLPTVNRPCILGDNPCLIQ